MATLEWVRDNYDSNKNRYIEESEMRVAEADWTNGTISGLDFTSVFDAYNAQTLLPVYSTEPTAITCNASTPHYSSGCELLKHYDANGDGVISMSDLSEAIAHKNVATITAEEYTFIESAWKLTSINALCPGCHATTSVCTGGTRRCRDSNTVEQCRSDESGWDVVQTCSTGYECVNGYCVAVSAPSPGMETRTTSLSEGSHTIQVSLSGYDTLNATIYISSSGNVSCTSGPCGSSSPPGVTTSGSTVTVYLVSGSATTGYDDWVNSKGGVTGLRNNLAAVGEIIDGYLSSAGDIGYLGFNVSLANIGTTIDHYLG